MSGRDSAAQVRAARRELEIPLVVVSAGRRSSRTAEVLATLQRDQVNLSKRSCQVTADRSGHGIALGQPEIIVDAIRATVEASRQVLQFPIAARLRNAVRKIKTGSAASSSFVALVLNDSGMQSSVLDPLRW
jgi:hypothetical protein